MGTEDFGGITLSCVFYANSKMKVLQYPMHG